MKDKLLHLFETRVPPDWVDYNAHMNDAAYVIAFSHATDRFMDHIGIDAAYRERTGRTIYTLENHVCYLQEVGEGDAVCVTTQLLGNDNKRLRVFHVLHRVGEGEPSATSEQMLLHVDQSEGVKVASFDDEIEARVHALAQAHVLLAAPEQAGRRIRELPLG